MVSLLQGSQGAAVGVRVSTGSAGTGCPARVHGRAQVPRSRGFPSPSPGVAGFRQPGLTQVQGQALPRNHRSVSGFRVSPTSPSWVTGGSDAGRCLWVGRSQGDWGPRLLEGALAERQRGGSTGAPRPAGPWGRLCAGAVLEHIFLVRRAPLSCSLRSCGPARAGIDGRPGLLLPSALSSPQPWSPGGLHLPGHVPAVSLSGLSLLESPDPASAAVRAG